MIERAYTIKEIDDLRQCCETKFLFGTYRLPEGGRDLMSRPYREAERSAAVENMVRTHMLAGHTAEDLRSAK